MSILFNQNHSTLKIVWKLQNVKQSQISRDLVRYFANIPETTSLLELSLVIGLIVWLPRSDLLKLLFNISKYGSIISPLTQVFFAILLRISKVCKCYTTLKMSRAKIFLNSQSFWRKMFKMANLILGKDVIFLFLYF